MKLRACPARFDSEFSPSAAAMSSGPLRPRRLCVRKLRDSTVATTLADTIYPQVSSTGWSFSSLPQHFRNAGTEVLGEVCCGRQDWRQGNEVALKALAASRQAPFEVWRSTPSDESLATPCVQLDIAVDNKFGSSNNSDGKGGVLSDG